MQIGIVGLGRMGGNIARRLMEHGHGVVVFDRNRDAVDALALAGATPAGPRAVWVMLPAGAPTEETITALGGALSTGDTIIDGGNTYYKDDVRRARELKAQGIH